MVSHRLSKRRAGVLLHPTSLPESPGHGDLGANAYWFVDFLASCGLSVWQTLPLGPPDAQLSPYQSISANAGNRRLICLQQLQQQGWLEHDPEAPPTDSSLAILDEYRQQRLSSAYENFQQRADATVKAEYAEFQSAQAHWLDDYAFFNVLKNKYQALPWWQWDAEYRDRDPETLISLGKDFAVAIDFYRFEQFMFFRQWLALKKYANERGILMFGDLPIFVSADSVDVWANRDNFLLNEEGRPSVVAGVPPDYFSATGQRWGNPHYNWEYMQANGFHWWVARLRTQQTLFDMVRIDHFRGFEAYWEIPADAPTAMEGRWIKAPGDALIKTLEQVGTVPLVAEDLGIITDEVTALRKSFNIPGMKILQFAFGDNAKNPYLPHNHKQNYVVYTGTHNNNTSLGWFQELSPEAQYHVCDYLGGVNPDDMPWPLIRTALASTAKLAIIPMQDILALDASHRMNTPGVSGGNWQWRFSWDQAADDVHTHLRHLLDLYGRLP